MFVSKCESDIFLSLAVFLPLEFRGLGRRGDSAAEGSVARTRVPRRPCYVTCVVWRPYTTTS